MPLVEAVRIIFVLALTAAGYQLGTSLPSFLRGLVNPATAPLVLSVIGAATGYVVGGVLGRGVIKAVGSVEEGVDRIDAGDLLAGTFGILVGAMSGVLLGLPIAVAVRPKLLGLPLFALLVVVLCYIGYRVALRKRMDLFQLMGLRQQRVFSADEGRASAGTRVLDTSALIDGRILDVVRSGFIKGKLICPGFVLEEIQSIADSADPSRRSRGRRALEVLEALQAVPQVLLEVSHQTLPGISGVDAKLIGLARRLEATLITTDFNLHRVAELQGVPVLNVNTLAASLGPAVLAGEKVTVRIVREGTGPGQGVGYLPDGTMVVVEEAAAQVGKEVEATVTSTLQTPAGRMLFASRPATLGEADGAI